MARSLLLFTLASLALALAVHAKTGSQEILSIKKQYLNLFKPTTTPVSASSAANFQIDTAKITKLILRDSLFGSMIPKHRQAVQEIVNILKGASSPLSCLLK